MARFKSITRKIALLICALTLLTASFGTIGEKQFGSSFVISGMAEISAVRRTNYLLVRGTQSQLYGIYNTSGKQLVSYRLHNPTYLSYSCFSDGKINKSELDDETKKLSVNAKTPENSFALVAADGGFVSKYEYGAIKVWGNYWALGLVVSAGSKDDYDYKFDSATYYHVIRCDVFHLGESPALVASLDKEAFNGASAHGDYITIRDASGNVKIYDSDFNETALSASKVSASPYVVVDYALTDTISGKLIADGCSSVTEVYTDKGLLFNVSRLDIRGKTQSGVCDLSGNWLMEPSYLTIKEITDRYALVTDDIYVGLYSFALKKLVIPCNYDSILTSKQTVDPYDSYGYVCGVKDGERHYFDAKNGRRSLILDGRDESYTFVGATACQELSKGRYKFISAGGVEKDVYDTRVYTSRGDGSLIVCRSYTNSMYGVYTMDGQTVLEFRYKYKPVITDDGNIIVHRYDELYDLISVNWSN